MNDIKVRIKDYKDNKVLLKDVTHYEDTFGESLSKFNINSNRFYLFDRDGNLLNEFRVRELEGYESYPVIETCISSFNGVSYGVGFPVTHIKLNIKNNNLINDIRKLKYGEVDVQ